MKLRIYFIIGILIFLVGVVVWEQVCVSVYLNNIEKKVEAIILDVENKTSINSKEIYNQVVELENEWDSYRTTLCFMVNLKDVEGLGVEITKIKTYVIEDDVTEFKAGLGLILFYLDNYRNIMGISFENVF